MAAEGIRFTDAHSPSTIDHRPSTICSPSRYGLFSGQQIYRSTGRGGGAFEGPGGASYLKPDTLTLGDMLKEKGYHTGIFGKWHVGLTWLDKDGKRLGGDFENSLLIDYEKSTPLVDGPNARGFDESFVTPNCPTTDPLYIYIENGMAPVPASQRHKRENVSNPGGKWRWDNDEGYWMREDHDHDPAGGWRCVKFDGWEGGRRVPFIARWPGRIPEAQVSDQMTNTTDIFATLASVVGYQLSDDAAPDSFDMLPAMVEIQDPQKSIRPHLLTQSFRREFRN